MRKDEKAPGSTGACNKTYRPDTCYDSYLCQRVIDDAPDGLIVYGMDLKYQLWSPAMERMTGLPASEVVGKHPLDLFPWLKDEGVIERLEKALQGEEAIKLDFPYELPSGKSGWASDNSGPLKNEKGEIIGVVAVVRDITYRKHLEQELRDRSWRMESIIEGTRAGSWEWNVQTGETVFSDIWAWILGYTLEELSPVSIKTWESMAHPDDLKKSAELLERHFSGELPYYDCECRMKHKDGRWIWVHDRGRVFTRTDDGKPLMMFGTHSEITDRKQIEAYRDITAELLPIFNEPGSVHVMIARIISALKERLELDAVGIRMQDGDDYPYFAQEGFSDEFINLENRLRGFAEDGEMCRDCDGNIEYDCACGLVVSGKANTSNPRFSRGGSYWTNDYSQNLTLPRDLDPRVNPRNQCARHGYSSVALVPIRARDRVIGLLQLNDKEKGVFSEVAIIQLESVAAHIGEAFARKLAEEDLIKAKDALAHESTHDPLTGVFNRRAMTEALAREIARVRRMNHGLAVAAFDIDRFKEINDTHGHLVGDEVLCGIVDFLKGVLRGYDLLGRWGGDEFLIISPDCGEFEGSGFYDRLRAMVADHPVPTKAGNIDLSISVGVKTWNENDTEENMLEAADAALYLAKKSGRNRSCRSEK